MVLARTLIILMSFAGFSVPVFAADGDGLTSELNELINLYLSASRSEQMKAVNRRIRFSGITDERLFNIAEKKVLSLYRDATSHEDEQYVSWMVQMLAFSGDEKYLPTLKKVLAEARSSVVKRHAAKSLEVLSKYERWNLVINKNLGKVKKEELWRVRVFNMLGAEDPELVRGVASIIDHYYINDIEVTDYVEQRLLALNLLAVPKDQRTPLVKGTDVLDMVDKKKDIQSAKPVDKLFNEYAEASAWLCRVLGNTRNRKYLKTLRGVNRTTKADAIARWSNIAIGSITEPPKPVDNTGAVY